MTASPDLLAPADSTLRPADVPSQRAATPLRDRSDSAIPFIIRGSLAAVQAIGAQYLLLLLIILTTVLATPYSLSGTPWNDSARAAAIALQIGHGGRPLVQDARISVVPLGLTCLAICAVFVTARRKAVATRAGFFSTVGTYTAALAFTALAAHLDALAIATAVGGGVAVSVLGVSLAMARGRVLDRVNPLHGRLPEEGIVGLKVGGLAIFSIIAASALLVGYWAFDSRASSAQAIAILAPGTIGIIMLTLGQLTVLPNMVAWISAWLIGPGFRLGAGTKYSTSEIVTGPLPQVPMMSALPPGAWSGLGFRWLAAIVVLIGMVGGLFARRTLKIATLRSTLLVIAIASTTFGLGLAVIHWLAGGALTSGRFAQIGANPWQVGGLGALEVALGIGMVCLGMFVWSHRADIRAATKRLGSRLRGA